MKFDYGPLCNFLIFSSFLLCENNTHGHVMASWKFFRPRQLVGIKMATLGRLKSSSLLPLITLNRSLVFTLRFPDLSSGSQRSPRAHLPPSQCQCALLPALASFSRGPTKAAPSQTAPHDTVRLLCFHSMHGYGRCSLGPKLGDSPGWQQAELSLETECCISAV